MPNNHADSYAAYEKASKKANRRNLAILFDKLAALEITSLSVEFDGSGDDGQIESITASPESVYLDAQAVEVEFVGSVSGASSRVTKPLREALEDACYDLLSAENVGWEINDGAYGTFVFNVPIRSVDLDFNARFTDSTNYSYSYKAEKGPDRAVAQDIGSRPASASDATPES